MWRPTAQRYLVWAEVINDKTSSTDDKLVDIQMIF
jgi:hypothetical protein